jgi:hypothetical protein
MTSKRIFVELFIKISREFLRKENIVIKKTSGSLQEGDVRDIFFLVQMW